MGAGAAAGAAETGAAGGAAGTGAAARALAAASSPAVTFAGAGVGAACTDRNKRAVQVVKPELSCDELSERSQLIAHLVLWLTSSTTHSLL